MVAVWAPDAENVEILLGDSAWPLKRSDRGWWQYDRALRHGEEYRFHVDDQSFPDPRSPFQPAGVHGHSCHVDHARFRWSDHQWQQRPLSSALMYELHIGTFTDHGTFD